MRRRAQFLPFSIILLTLLSFPAVSPHIAYPQESNIEQAEEKLIEAFMAIKQAEKAGARKEELDELVLRLNKALYLLERARKGEIERSAISNAIELSKSVIAMARELEVRASSHLFRVKVFLLISVPISSAITAFGLNYAYKWWHRREIERILRMIVKKREEKAS